MHRLRALIPLGLALAPVTAWAMEESLTSTFLSDSGTGRLTPAQALGSQAPPVSNRQERVGYRLDGVTPWLNVLGSVTVGQPDYSAYLVRDRQGIDRPLAAGPDELTGEQAFEWVSGPHKAWAGWNGSLNASPFAFQSLAGGYQRGFFENSTLVGFELTYLRQAQPFSTFIDRDFRTVERPGAVHAYEFRLTYDQLLSARWKMLADLSASERIEERPRNLGLRLGAAYAPADRWSLQLKGRRIAELTDQALKNERGYFSLSEGELAVTWEPAYDLLCSVSYGQRVERELDPATAGEVQVASDLYGAGVQYLFHNYEFRLQAGLSQSNTGYRGSNFSGGVTWKL